VAESPNITHSPSSGKTLENPLWACFCLVLVVFTIVALWIGWSGAILDENPFLASTVNDIRQLSVALESFKTKYAVYPPSRILLANDRNEYKGERKSSLDHLSAIWPRLKWDEKIDWSGGVPGFKSAKLEGDQCLVYFLNGPRGEGFSTNPANPTSSGGRRAGPFFEFAENRLVHRVKGNAFSSYKDGYGKNVYAYFCGRSPGKYSTDCPSLKVAPYYKKESDPVRYYHQNTFQIISAGMDGIFGPGGAWSPESAAEDAGKHGADDLSNFHGELLGK